MTQHPVPIVTPEDVTAWRRVHRLSRKRAAELLGMSERGYAIWETGYRERKVPWWVAAVLHYIDCPTK